MKSLLKLAVVVMGLSITVSAFAEGQTRKKKSSTAAAVQKEESWNHKGTPAATGLTHHHMAGCGLGSMVIQDNSKWMQVLAATLNGTAGSQTFGMTSGTSNCTEDGVMQASREKEAFLEANAVELRRDLAQGNGEYLSSLSSLYGCKGEAFSKNLRKSQAKVLQPKQSAQESLRVMDSVASQSSCQG